MALLGFLALDDVFVLGPTRGGGGLDERASYGLIRNDCLND